MTYKEKRDHKFRILFMYDILKGDIDIAMSNYFENIPYNDEDDSAESDLNRNSHQNVAKVVIGDTNEIENESDKAITINLSDEANIRDIKNKVKDLISKISDIDNIIKESLSTWDINRVGKAELTIIRLAIYEMYYDSSIDIPVAINEAVELAKEYGDEKASKFVNGVLSTIYKKKHGDS